MVCGGTGLYIRAAIYDYEFKEEQPVDTSDFKKNGIYITSSDAHQPLYNGTYQFSIKDNEWWHVKENIFDSNNWTQEAPND